MRRSSHVAVCDGVLVLVEYGQQSMNCDAMNKRLLIWVADHSQLANGSADGRNTSAM